MEQENRLAKARKPYLHESRHQHAVRRQRGQGGRFQPKKDDGGEDGGKEKSQEKLDGENKDDKNESQHYVHIDHNGSNGAHLTAVV